MGNAISRAIRAVVEPVERRILFAAGLDPTWGDGGSVTAPHGGADDGTEIYSVGMQSDGKVVVLTREYLDPGEKRTLVRYNADGSLDASFGAGGVLALADEVKAFTISVMPDDRLLLDLSGFSTESILEMRTADGAIDTGFGESGRVSLHRDVDSEQLIGTNTVVAPDGDIYVAQNGPWSGADATTGEPIDVWRLNADGSLDNAFSDDGHLQFDDGGGSFELVLEPNGDLLLGWTGFRDPGRLHRIKPDGRLEPDIAEVKIGPREILGVQSDGKVLALMSVYYELQARVARFNPDGSLDKTYGEDGYAIAAGPFPGVRYDPNIIMTVDSEDRAVVFLTDWSAGKTHMVRFDTAGEQESLGIIGSLPLNVGDPRRAVAQPDGKILVVSSPYRISRVDADDDDAPLPDIDLAGGTLAVRGTASADTILVSRSGSDVVLSRNGATTTYPADDVRDVAIDALDGNDVVTISTDLETTIVARGGADTITTGDANDFVRGGDGDDVINTGIGQDTVEGEAGDDSITCGDAKADVNLDEPRVDASHSVFGGDGDDTIICGAGEDRIDAGEGDNRITLGYGEDSVFTGDGNNHVELPEGFVYSGAGDDTIYCPGDDWYAGCWVRDTGGNDSMVTGEGFDHIELSGGGDDTVQTGGGWDGVEYSGGDADAGIGLQVDTGEGQDGVHADVATYVRVSPDEWYWGEDADGVFVIHPRGPIYLGAGNDWCRTFDPATIYGGDGNDSISTGGGRDMIYCGAGNDVVHAGSGSDLISGGGGNDKLFGQGGRDRIYGGAGNDRLEGQGGDDRLLGALGADTITGGGGDDSADEDEEDEVAGVELLLA